MVKQKEQELNVHHSVLKWEQLPPPFHRPVRSPKSLRNRKIAFSMPLPLWTVCQEISWKRTSAQKWRIFVKEKLSHEAMIWMKMETTEGMETPITPKLTERLPLQSLGLIPKVKLRLLLLLSGAIPDGSSQWRMFRWFASVFSRNRKSAYETNLKWFWPKNWMNNISNTFNTLKSNWTPNVWLQEMIIRTHTSLKLLYINRWIATQSTSKFTLTTNKSIPNEVRIHFLTPFSFFTYSKIVLHSFSLTGILLC